MRLARCLVFLALCATPWVTMAGTATGVVTKVYARDSDGLVLVTLSNAPTGSPACARFPYFLIRDENSAAGKRQFAILLTARSTGQLVTIIGRNTCNRWFDGEDIDSVDITN
jgi:hypothetical protein